MSKNLFTQNYSILMITQLHSCNSKVPVLYFGWMSGLFASLIRFRLVTEKCQFSKQSHWKRYNSRVSNINNITANDKMSMNSTSNLNYESLPEKDEKEEGKLISPDAQWTGT